MNRIVINDLDPTNSLFIELTDEESSQINGEGFWKKLAGFALIIGGAFTTPVGIGAAMIGAGGGILASEDDW